MKRFRNNGIHIIIPVLLIILIGAGDIQAAAADKFYLYVNGKAVSFPDQKPYIDRNNRTMVPVRFPAETLGAEVEFDFSNPRSQEVYIKQKAHDNLPEVEIVLKIGDNKVKVNGENKTMDTVAVVSNNRTMVPARFISEYLGAEVRWHEASKAAHVFSRGQSQAEQDEIILDTASKLGVKRPYIPQSPVKPVTPVVNK